MAVITERVLLDTQDAFDGVAAGYDRANRANPILAAMRRQVLATVGAHVPRGSRLLDLGCGPGTDDEVLGRAGYEVTALDWSPAMVAEARRAIDAANLRDRVHVVQLGIQQLDRLAPAIYDAACSNFGPLNCVPDLADAARQISARLRVGGVLVASVIGRLCPWEIGLYLSRGELARLRVRFATGSVPVPLNGRTVWTYYYGTREFTRIFEAAGFARLSLRSLGLFVPPPYLHAFAARHPVLTRRLQRLDEIAGGWPGLRSTGDHFLIVLRKAA